MRLSATLRPVTRLTGSLGVATITTFGDATALVSDILAPKTAYISTGKVTGTMVNRGEVDTDITAVAQSVSIAAGYHNGSGVVKIAAADQAKLIAGNIKSGVTVLGVAGGLVEGDDTSSGDAVEGDIALGKIAWVDGVELTGTSTKNADTTNATATENSLLYGHTAYGADGTKLTGAGAYWQYATRVAFPAAAGPETIKIYAPLCVSLESAFYNTDIAVKHIDITFGTLVAGGLLNFCRQAAGIQTVTLSGNTSLCTSANSMFRLASALTTVNGALDFSSCTNFTDFATSCLALVAISFVPSTIKASLSFGACSLLSTASLLSIANGLDSAVAPKTLTMHATSKTNMDAIIVDNNAGVAEQGSAMTLTQFINNIKGWTIA